MEFGAFTFGDVPIGPGGLDAVQRIRNLGEEIRLFAVDGVVGVGASLPG